MDLINNGYCVLTVTSFGRCRPEGRLSPLEITVNLQGENGVYLCWLLIYCILALELVEKVEDQVKGRGKIEQPCTTLSQICRLRPKN